LTQSTAAAGELLDETTRGTGAQAYFDYTPEKDIWVDVSEETGAANAASSYMYHVAALASDITIDFDIYPAGGTGVAVWTLVSSLTSVPLSSCAAAGVDQIEAAVRPYADTTAPLVVVGTWPCAQVDPYFYYHPDGNGLLFDSDPTKYELGSGHTKSLAPGDYFVELRGKRAGAVVGTTADAYFHADNKNIPHIIHNTAVTITDR
jgi:hypothetical protein